MKKKIFDIISALLVISILAFIFIQLSPGDPAENYLRASHLPVTDELLKQKREELGLNSPLIIQYLKWLKNVLLGNFGYSFLRKEPAIYLTFKSLHATFQLTIFSTFLIILISLPIGILSAIKTGTWIDKIVISTTTIFVSMPVFWLGFSLILLFSVKLNWLPVSGRGGFLNFVLPSITLSVPFIGQYIEFIKKSILENIQNNLLENAVLRGLKKRYIISNYLLKGAWIPILSGFSFTFVSILTGSILVEEIFSWPGIGFLFTKAIQAGDVPLIQACIMVFGMLFIIATHFMNGILKYLDPRIKGGKNNG